MGWGQRSSRPSLQKFSLLICVLPYKGFLPNSLIPRLGHGDLPALPGDSATKSAERGAVLVLSAGNAKDLGNPSAIPSQQDFSSCVTSSQTNRTPFLHQCLSPITCGKWELFLSQTARVEPLPSTAQPKPLLMDPEEGQTP